MTTSQEPARLLVVCIGNVCRSPLAERLLASRLPADRFSVSSAGVGALVGEPMDAEAAAELERLGASADGFTARQLTPALVEDADLVLTATVGIRSRVLQDSPGALRRAFTLRELATLLDVLSPVPDLTGLVTAAARERSRNLGRDLDVADPYRRGPEAHAAAAAQVETAVTRIARGLTSLGA